MKQPLGAAHVEQRVLAVGVLADGGVRNLEGGGARKTLVEQAEVALGGVAGIEDPDPLELAGHLDLKTACQADDRRYHTSYNRIGRPCGGRPGRERSLMRQSEITRTVPRERAWSDWSRRDFLRRGGLTAGLLVAPGVLAACGDDDDTAGGGGALEALRSQGSITVGIAGEKPYAYLEGGELTGMDPSVQMAIWGNLGIDDVRAQQVAFDGLIPGLLAQRFNVVAAGMFITPERCGQAAFSDPMYCAPNAFLVPPGNPQNISDF